MSNRCKSGPTRVVLAGSNRGGGEGDEGREWRIRLLQIHAMRWGRADRKSREKKITFPTLADPAGNV